MKSTVYLLLLLSVASGSCKTAKPIAGVAVDPVCGMKVNKSESIDWKYEGTKYYFDSYQCRESFKSNPQSFLSKECVANENIIDPVCGVKVILEESYDYKYEGRVYHFHSYECKQAFKMDPDKFVKNICGPRGPLDK
jgi:YHS domain-containing protein